jgi:hypothetical protein
MGDEGFEQPSDSPRNSKVSENGGAEFGAVDAPIATTAGSSAVSTDPTLTRLIDAWPTIPEHIRAAIHALVEAATVPTLPPATRQHNWRFRKNRSQ